ncbi:MAG: DoxX family protein [Bacteroidales bacterium]|nr:DoxX family protein [Bacteroidales bacterium]
MTFGPNRHRFSLRRFCAWLIGLVFLFSGVFKLMDPVGTAYIVQAYFHFFHLSFLDGIARGVGILLSLTEGIVGVALVTGIQRKITAIAASILIGFFLLLTLILWIANPEMDCGCFGEAFHLTHAQSFYKNGILALLGAAAWAGNRKMGGTRRYKYVSAGIGVVSLLVFCVLANIGLPLMDFTDYKPGERLRVSDEFSAAAPELPLRTRDGVEADEMVAFGPVMTLSFYDRPSARKWEAAKRFVSEADAAGFQPVLICAEPWFDDVPYFLSDRKILSTYNRSNGGVSYLYDGEIVAKWSRTFRPSASALQEIAAQDYVETRIGTTASRERHFEGFLLGLLAVLMLL